MCSRGQTPVDYLIGISLVLVTILGTFALVPMVFDPFEPAVSPDKQSMADRLADNLIANNTYPGEARTLNRTDLDNSLNDLNTTDAGIPDRERVNVTVQNGAGTQVATGGESFPPNVGGVAMAVRTFTTRNQTCGPSDSELNSCQLIVRVWG
jgi:hypothetical protein